MPKLRLTALTAAACLVAAVAPAAHASSLVFTGIRPGTLLLLDGGGSCTANFVFQTTGNAFDPTQQLYLGTAGHCVDLDDSIRALVVPPNAPQITSALVTVGTVVLDALPNNANAVSDAANDFALIAINPSLKSWVSPSMAWWGGPTGSYAGGATTVTWTGNALAAGGVVPRVGSLPGFGGATIQVDPTVDASGDSGSAVNSIDGLAVGSLTYVTGAIDAAGESVSTHARGPSITSMLALAGHPLATCASAKPWPRPGCPPL
jgi:hypothetical protein